MSAERPVAAAEHSPDRAGPDRAVPGRGTRDRTGPVAGAGRPDGGSVRLALTLGGLVLALLAGFGLGRLDTGAAGSPAGRPLAEAAADHTHPAGTAPHEHPTGGTAPAGGADVGGLSLSSAGYTLVPTGTALPVGRRTDFRFQVRGADRRPVTGFAVVHDKPMHLIVARRDLSGYQHLHPTMASDGTWSVPVLLPAAGIWRAYADFTALDSAGGQHPVTLGVDLVAAGSYAPRALPPPAREATVDGFTVTYEGTPQVGATQPLLFRVFSGGNPVTALEPYLGAYGHLVALREGDLGYVHVHPEPELANGAVKFWLAAPSAGRYRLYLDFQVSGTVRTAEFTLTVP
ncbi:hypothetical protein [Plantactinospora sp. CA-290183]|uniref:hypothetical protein n=1 Tax=Plantactinospora sp. CA-290183 TaxID=3240006 RepID=UPI003D90D0E0